MTANDDRLERIENKIDDIRRRQDDYQLAVEHRVTVLETKAKGWGAFMGFVAGIGSAIATSFWMKH